MSKQPDQWPKEGDHEPEDKEYDQAQQSLLDLANEVAESQMPWWRRLMRQKPARGGLVERGNFDQAVRPGRDSSP